MAPTNRAECIAAAARGARLKYVFFWGHRPRRRGVVDGACFSQWFAAPFEVEGLRYPTAEHFMMAEKARLFGDVEALSGALQAKNPGAAKAWGRKVRGFDEARWREHRFDIVVRGSVAKFGAHPELRAYLLQTKERVLVEASPRDRIWGIGLAADDPRARDPRRWKGENLLGFALVEARRRLRR